MAYKYGIVLSDELYIEYNRFTHFAERQEHFPEDKQDYDGKVIKKILSYFKIDILTNIAQIKRTNSFLPLNITSGLAKSGFKNQSLEELVKETTFKIILCTDRDDYPYVNINKDKIENNLTATFVQDEPRDKAINHLKALCVKAKEISIYDKYFSNANADNKIATLVAILPKRKLTIKYTPTPAPPSSQTNPPQYLSEADIDKLRSTCADWSFEVDNNTKNFHDRYLTIDHKMEVILTSGFEYLGNSTKDFTYVVRELKEDNQ